MVVVTSRTVVAERVDIPPETPIVKLEEFDDDQVRQWLAVWNRANATATASGRLRAFTAEDALVQIELARQPLLLLMLAIYHSDPDTPIDTGDLSLAKLYQELLHKFAVREVAKRSANPLRREPLRHAVNEHLYRLAVAAIGMFNRGRQDITEAELGADLRGLERGDDVGTDTDNLGRRVLGEFFFVHAAEARLRSESGGVRRCYEFLHATFGEYLIAALIVDELAAVADAAFGGSRGPREPADDLLHALLSHQTLASRQPILEFARELIHALSEADQDRISRTLEVLAQRYDRRTDNQRFHRYQPLAESSLRRLAAYSANLILLRALPFDGVPVTAFAADHDGPVSRWSSTVDLWRAGLDFDGWKAMLDTVELSQGNVRINLGGAWQPEFGALLHARLVGDPQAERQLRIGAAFYHNSLYYIDGDNWVEAMTSWLIPAVVQTPGTHAAFLLVDPPDGTTEEDQGIVLDLLSKALIRQARNWSHDFIRLLLEWVIRNFALDRLEPIALAVVVAAKKRLVTEIPALGHPDLYQSAAARWLLGEYSSTQDSSATREDIAAALGTPSGRVLHTRPGFYSISVVREGGPVPMGSVTGSLRAGDRWEPDGPLPLALD